MNKIQTKFSDQKLVTEIDTPEGIVNFLQKRNGLLNYHANSRYSVTDIVGCLRKAFYKEYGIEPEELLRDATIENMWGASTRRLLTSDNLCIQVARTGY